MIQFSKLTCPDSDFDTLHLFYVGSEDGVWPMIGQLQLTEDSVITTPSKLKSRMSFDNSVTATGTCARAFSNPMYCPGETTPGLGVF